MDAVKRASFAAKQLPAGPAPLASFEDLPSDELESPEDNFNSDSLEKQTTKEKSDSSNTIPVNTPGTASSQSTPRIESDFDSQFTLTPSDSSKTPLAIDFHTGSFSSLSKDETLSVKQKKGSVVSLGNFDAPKIDYDQRKSSWTDVFHNHNDHEISDPIAKDGKEKAPKRKSKHESTKKDQADLKSKDKVKFLSIFKGKRSGKSLDCIMQPESIEANGNVFLDSEKSELDLGVLDGKENELPKQIELHPIQMQNDLDKKSSNIQNENLKTVGNNKQNDLKNALNIAEKEYNILSHGIETECKKAINEECSKNHKVEYEFESSESEIGSEARRMEKTNEIEAETLISQDSVEVEDDSLLELCPFVFKAPNPVPLMSRQQRQDVTTIPVERPRSTTPINVAPLEAFIRSASPSFDSHIEKIKLSLPGEQFLGRLKSPKRGSSKSWADFCVEVLHSPRMQKHDNFPEENEEVFNLAAAEDKNSSCWDKFDISENPWVTFESKPVTDNFQHLFEDLAITEQTNFGGGDITKTQTLSKQFSKCPCQCHFKGCDNVYIDSDKTGESFVSKSVPTDIDLFSDKCQCQCHERYLHLWSPTNFMGDLEFPVENDHTELSNLDASVTEGEI